MSLGSIKATLSKTSSQLKTCIFSWLLSTNAWATTLKPPSITKRRSALLKGTRVKK
jgi:hypothetical protein